MPRKLKTWMSFPNRGLFFSFQSFFFFCCVYLFLIMNVRHAETYILWQDLIWFHVSFFFPFLFHFIFCALFSPSNAYTYWQCYSTIYLINRNINNVECIGVVWSYTISLNERQNEDMNIHICYDVIMVCFCLFHWWVT